MQVKIYVYAEVDASNIEDAECAGFQAVRNALKLVEANGFSYDEEKAKSVQIFNVICRGIIQRRMKGR